MKQSWKKSAGKTIWGLVKLAGKILTVSCFLFVIAFAIFAPSRSANEETETFVKYQYIEPVIRENAELKNDLEELKKTKALEAQKKDEFDKSYPYRRKGWESEGVWYAHLYFVQEVFDDTMRSKLSGEGGDCTCDEKRKEAEKRNLTFIACTKGEALVESESGEINFWGCNRDDAGVKFFYDEFRRLYKAKADWAKNEREQRFLRDNFTFPEEVKK